MSRSNLARNNLARQSAHQKGVFLSPHHKDYPGSRPSLALACEPIARAKKPFRKFMGYLLLQSGCAHSNVCLDVAAGNIQRKAANQITSSQFMLKEVEVLGPVLDHLPAKMVVVIEYKGKLLPGMSRSGEFIGTLQQFQNACLRRERWNLKDRKKRLAGHR